MNKAVNNGKVRLFDGAKQGITLRFVSSRS